MTKTLLDNETRMNILRYLKKNGECYNAEIAKNLKKPNGEIGYDESKIIRDLSKLLYNGYIKLVEHLESDKIKYYKLTKKGLKAIENSQTI